MNDPGDEFVRSTLGMLAKHLAELASYVGMVNALLVKSDDPTIAGEATFLNDGLTELHASIKRVADAFPPSAGNGFRSQ